MRKRITLAGKPVSYLLRASKRARHVRLTVESDGTLVATLPPRVAESVLERFIREKTDWIFRHLSERAGKRQVPTADTRRDYLAKKEAARTLVLERLEHFNAHYGFTYNTVRIKNLKSQWGSCSAKKNLNFNYKVIYLPPAVADYVIVHELCHLKELNHSKHFWNLVRETLPDVEERETALKQVRM